MPCPYNVADEPDRYKVDAFGERLVGETGGHCDGPGLQCDPRLTKLQRKR